MVIYLLGRPCSGAVVEGDCAAEGLGAALGQRQLLHSFPEAAAVPPERSAVARHRHRLGACFGLQPRKIIYRVPAQTSKPAL